MYDDKCDKILCFKRLCLYNILFAFRRSDLKFLANQDNFGFFITLVVKKCF